MLCREHAQDPAELPGVKIGPFGEHIDMKALGLIEEQVCYLGLRDDLKARRLLELPRRHTFNAQGLEHGCTNASTYRVSFLQ